MRFPKSKLNRSYRWHLPYGAYLTDDGTVTIFDRRYQPLFTWKRREGVVVETPDRFVPHTGQVWFYNDSTSQSPAVITDLEKSYLAWAMAAGHTWALKQPSGQPKSVQRIRRPWLPPIMNRRGSVDL